MTSVDPFVGAPAKYKENLDAFYYGGYLGFEQVADLGGGWSLKGDATAGLYYTRVNYEGKYSGYTLVIPGGYYMENGEATAAMDRGSFIGTLRIDLKRQLGWGELGVFGQGEYLSYVPRVAYNNNDEASSYLLGGIVGTQNGTKLSGAEAINLSTGINITVPVN